MVELPDGSCFVSEAAAGRVVHVRDGNARPVITGLGDPHSLALLGDELLVVDRAAKSLRVFNRNTGKTALIAEHLPVGSAPGIVARTLPGIVDSMPGPLLPFCGLAATRDGRILIGAEGAGAVLAVARS